MSISTDINNIIFSYVSTLGGFINKSEVFDWEHNDYFFVHDVCFECGNYCEYYVNNMLYTCE